MKLFQLIKDFRAWRKEKREAQNVSTFWANKGIAKLGEECSELTVVMCKAMMVGGLDKPHWSGNLTEMAQDELGDVLASAEYVISRNNLDRDVIKARVAKKTALYLEWEKEGSI